MGSGVHYLGNGAVDLQAVPVEDSNEVIKLVVGGEHCRLPNLSLLALTVAKDGVDAVGVTVNLCRQGHTAGGGEAETERAGGHIDAGNALHIGMSLKTGVGFTESFYFFLREKSALSESGVKAGSGMTLRKHEAVAICLCGILRIYIHFLKIKIGEDVGDRKRSAGMAASGVVNTLNDAETHLICYSG